MSPPLSRQPSRFAEGAGSDTSVLARSTPRPNLQTEEERPAQRWSENPQVAVKHLGPDGAAAEGTKL